MKIQNKIKYVRTHTLEMTKRQNTFEVNFHFNEEHRYRDTKKGEYSNFIIVIVNLITDLTYGFADPRVKNQ